MAVRCSAGPVPSSFLSKRQEVRGGDPPGPADSAGQRPPTLVSGSHRAWTQMQARHASDKPRVYSTGPFLSMTARGRYQNYSHQPKPGAPSGLFCHSRFPQAGSIYAGGRRATAIAPAVSYLYPLDARNRTRRTTGNPESPSSGL